MTRLPWEDDLAKGPVDDYIEVVDYDPASKMFYAPVDLNHMNIVAQDGLPPSESNPQFHQQMVYAVARATIDRFEKALGRKALWSPHVFMKDGKVDDDPVQRLRIYPHALREANAYYSPVKKALLFGYFPASVTDPGEGMPGETVFTCLSHDIVAHETTHALLDGLHRRANEPSNMDVLALHEAFADIVAMLQHFTYPEVLRNQINRTRGDLQRQNLLGELAYQFGQAVGSYGALRNALGHTDRKTKEWVPETPDPAKLSQTTEPHARGSILVAAVFEAFLTIYKRRVADLLRIATGGTGTLPAGELHPDLVQRLAQEASKSASHVLQMCIRAWDYCPPVDVDFGDYLRALITADADLVTDDSRGYRLAVIEAFRRRGIFPRDVRNLSQESLVWEKPKPDDNALLAQAVNADTLLGFIPDWEVTKDRKRIYEQSKDNQIKVHKRLMNMPAVARAARIVLDKSVPQAFYRNKDSGVPYFEVHSVRPACRTDPDGRTVTELIIEMTQRRRGYYDLDRQRAADRGQSNPPPADFIFRGGCTLVIDPYARAVKYCVYKDITNENRLNRMREFLTGDEDTSLRATYFGDVARTYYRELVSMDEAGNRDLGSETFALLHRSFGQEEVQA